MRFISNYSEANISNWREFVFNHPKGNVFHTPEMVQVYERTKNYFPKVVIAMNQSEIMGVLVGVVQKEYSGLLGYFSSRCIVFGQPLVKSDNPDILDSILMEFRRILKKKVIYSQFRNSCNMNSFNDTFINNGFRLDPHFDILIDLKDSFENLKMKMHKSRIRNYKKSINKGSTIKVLDSIEQIKSGFDLLLRTYNRNKLPLPNISHFEAIFEILQNQGLCRCLGIYYEKQMIGFRIALVYKNIIYDYYAGSDDEHTNKYPNDVLIFELLKWGCSSNQEYFDFGGAGKPGIPYGVRDHKLKFGGKIYDFGRYELIHQPISYEIAKIGLKIWRKAKVIV